ncbi:hypothetical protein TNCV_2668781 [Trichonephila clavipes]|nr:hypothetical protein TNCV_2668781 [Trichonephila clavipes]
MTPELAPPLLTTTLHQREDVSALDRFNVYRCPTRRVFGCTGLELVTRLGEGEDNWEALRVLSWWDDVLSQNWSGAKPNRTAFCTGA